MKKIIQLITLLILIIPFCLKSQDWVRQYPNELVSQLNDVAFNLSGHGLAVGEQGAILSSSDWGQNWQLIAPPQDFQSYKKVSFIPLSSTLTAFTATNNYLYKTTDGGQTWSQTSNIAIGGCNDLIVLSENEIFINNGSSMRHSTDGGATWNFLNKPMGISTIHSMYFLSNQKGWIGTTNGHIYHTTDGGSNWAVQDTTQFSDRVRLKFLNDNIGFGGVNKQLIKTTDGGATWNVSQQSAFGTHIEDIAIIDVNNVVFSQGNRTFVTHDGGDNTTLVRPAPYASVNKGAFAMPDGRVWVASSFLLIAISEDMGDSYTDQVFGNKNSLQAIDFIDPMHGWAAGYNATILKTSDGGAHWEDVSPDMSTWQVTRCGATISANEFWVGGDGFLAKTTDGGQSWTDLNQSASGIAITNSAVHICNSGGVVSRSTDGGQNWSSFSIANQTYLSAICFPSENVGYVGGFDAVLAKTTDGGLSWTPIAAPTADKILSVWFYDDNTGWLTIDKFSTSAFYTTDGGQSWNEGTLPYSSYWRNIRFIDPLNGWVAGGSSGTGRVAKTTDGGHTWEDAYLADEFAQGLDIVNTNNGQLFWICGPGGSIEHSTTVSSSLYAPILNENLEIMPNPSTGEFGIEGDFTKDAVLEVFDLRGRMVYRQQHPDKNHQVRVDLNSGIYVIRVRDGLQYYAGKLIIE
ncbi:MAG: T9SS type A sorting domain-containing protein [Lewinellaceae bacterium]|nr:T9SS type A sorting domain-containing protein [Saprospiraceae bacterium]MCB9343013.1 T9SS type A sorting domain-containing protein [Lewinellaceae bacterium]